MIVIGLKSSNELRKQNIRAVTEKKIMENHTTLTFITALAISALVGMAALAGTPAQEIKGQLTDNNAIARYSQELMNKLCQDNPFRSHEIPAIIIPGISGKNGGIAIYGNANATADGKNGPISIGGDYKSGSVTPYNGNFGNRAGNGGIALCGTANGQNRTGG